jgi:hypothetical protein
MSSNLSSKAKVLPSKLLKGRQRKLKEEDGKKEKSLKRARVYQATSRISGRKTARDYGTVVPTLSTVPVFFT